MGYGRGALGWAALAILLSAAGCAVNVAIGVGNTPASPERKPPASPAPYRESPQAFRLPTL
ncbi:MAG: hypothetical protein ACKN9T_16975 [Candidatus Methylumidiphilus sp.]